MLGVDLNYDHLAAVLTDPSGNPCGAPTTIALELAGLPAQTRDGRLRAAITALVVLAKAHGCVAVAIENLDFADLRAEGKEHSGKRPSRGPGAGRSGGGPQGSPRGGSGTGSPRWPPTPGSGWSRSTPRTRPSGAPSTGSARCKRSQPVRAATMRRPSSSRDAGSGSEHGDGKGVTRPQQSMGDRELPTPPCGPCRQTPACPRSERGTPRPTRPEGSRTNGARPEGLTGVPPRTRCPRTVRGRPQGRTQFCSVFRNGGPTGGGPCTPWPASRPGTPGCRASGSRRPGACPTSARGSR